MAKELYIGAIDLSTYFQECKKVRGGLEIRLKAVPWALWLEFSHFFQWRNEDSLDLPLYVAWRNWEYNILLHKMFHLGGIWGKGDYCLECRHKHGMTVYLKFDPIMPSSEEDIYKKQNIE